jgi:hypothetical protein
MNKVIPALIRKRLIENERISALEGPNCHKPVVSKLIFEFVIAMLSHFTRKF